ncbi:MAG: 3'-5' exonuclease [Bacteroidales bacterium]|nr:3'-5' exonuclease [Bacteroidales bacterium]HNZ42212.1 3'-5' exonuclease [Bacteroidales bacterium]
MKLKLSKPLAIFDIETTGLNIATDRIVEICIIREDVNGETLVKTMRLNPTIPIPPMVTAIHGITDEDVKDCPTFNDIAHDLNQFLDNCDMAGYNSNKYDIPLLVEEFLRAGIEFNLANRRFVDVQNIFHRMEPRNLKGAYKFYCQKDIQNAHSAEADTRATYEILMAQLDRYLDVEFTDNDGKISKPIINDVQALHNFSFKSQNVDLVGHIVYNENNVEVFNFGKHKGKPVEEVFQKEPSYYDWMSKAEFPLSTKKVINAIKLRGFNKSSVKISPK